MSKHRGTYRFADIIEYMFLLNIGLACGIIFCIAAEILQVIV